MKTILMQIRETKVWQLHVEVPTDWGEEQVEEAFNEVYDVQDILDDLNTVHSFFGVEEVRDSREEAQFKIEEEGDEYVLNFKTK